VVQDFSTVIQRGDRVGIVGRNGIGKTTLVKLLLGELQPNGGSVQLGTRLEIAYSDQLRGQLQPDANLIDNICGGQEFIEINGQRRHAISYLGDFLFTPERVRTPVKALSGGERNRAILARLFTRPANLLVLDEPTNDLDIETLELLEEILAEFKGTLLLVSHDRDFMDRVVTSLLVMDEQGRVEEQAGGYSNWEARGGRLIAERVDPTRTIPTSGSEPTAAPAAAPKEPRGNQRRKLSYREKTELAELPARIEALEQQQSQLQAKMAAADFYDQDPEVINDAMGALAQLTEDIDRAMERWAELED
jgi:ATP-binding cassette subfamily F protein uup